MPLVITSGYGSGIQLTPTSGYGDAFPTFLGNGFRFESVEILDASKLRARFTRTPNSATTGPYQFPTYRADEVSNWVLTGPSGVVPIQITTTAIDDVEVIDIGLFDVLEPGDYTLAIASTVLSLDASPYSLEAPYQLGFNLSEISQDEISKGALNDPSTSRGECEDLISRLFNPAFRSGSNWQAVINAIALGDCAIRRQAQDSLAQLYISTATSTYLQKRAADTGVQRPRKTGMTDDIFRGLVVSVVNSKLTQGAFLEVLEAFYGRDAVSAFAETDVAEPYTLFDGANLRVVVDEKYTVDIVFKRQDFSVFRRASAQEVASAITRAFETRGATAFAIATTDATTDTDKVRIYSGSRGLISSVRVVYGTANLPLQFETNSFPLPDPSPGFPQWTIEVLTSGKVRFHASSDTLFNLGAVEPGDYINVLGTEFLPENRGSFVVEATSYRHVGTALVWPTLEQWVEVSYAGAIPQVVSQSEYQSLQIFRPRKEFSNDLSSYGVVFQKNGVAGVNIAATTRAVNRTTQNAAYLQDIGPIEFSVVGRDNTGLVTVTTTIPHGISPSQQFIIDDFKSSIALPPVIGGSGSGTLNSYNIASGSSGLSQGTHWAQDTSFKGVDFKTVTDLDSRLWIFGGITSSNNGTQTPITTASVFDVTASSLDSQGARSYDYLWTKGSIVPQHSRGSSLVVSSYISEYDTIFGIGGYVTGPWNDMSGVASMYGNVTKYYHKSLKETVLVDYQLSNTIGIKSGLPIWFTSNPISGDLLTVSNGVTTRTYGFGVGGDVTVGIGGTAAITTSNLSIAINGDGGAIWETYNATGGLVGFPNPFALVVVEDFVSASRSGLRAWGNAGLASRTQVVSYGISAGYVKPDYTSGAQGALPTANPGFGTSGFHRAVTSLVINEVHYTLDGVYRYWNGSSWPTQSDWIIPVSSGILPELVAEASSSVFPGTNVIQVTGGIDAINHAISHIQEGFSAWNLRTSELIEPRCQHQSFNLTAGPDTGKVIIIGGRNPCDDSKRAGLGFSTWDFDDAWLSATFTGPVPVSVSGTTRPVGKKGFGAGLAGASIGTGGAPQTAMNTALLGDYTITGWMDSSYGTVFRNGVVAWGAQADNTLIAFGSDASDNKFFIRWMSGVTPTVHTLKTVLVRSELQTDSWLHHFAITKTVSLGIATFALYIDGNQASLISSTGTAPDGGTNGNWAFGQTDDIIGGFVGDIDSVGFSATVLNAVQIKEQFYAEVGVLHDHPDGVNYSPVGKVLNTCEIIPYGTTNIFPPEPTGSMATARFGFGAIVLPDGRIVVCGGCGYNPSTDAFPYNKSQRQIELKSCEIYNPALGYWSPLPDMAEPHSHPSIAYVARENRIYISGGFSSLLTEYLDISTMTWGVSIAALPLQIKARGGGGLAGDDDVVVSAGGGQLVLYDGEYVIDTNTTGNRDHSMTPTAETLISGGINGSHVAVSGTSGTTLKFMTPRHARWSTGTTGVVSAVTAAPAVVGKGPFVFEPSSGFSVSKISGVVQSVLEGGKKYQALVIGTNEATSFPDAPGYLVFDWGNSRQTGPVSYSGRLSNSSLGIDAGFKFPVTIPVGTTVRLVYSKSPFTPSSPINSFWLTASNAGLIGAKSMLYDISASGIDLDITTRYPGDIGLGGAGRPVESNYKLSDIVGVFGSDNLDAEIGELHEV
jgi:hypothetical protein